MCEVLERKNLDAEKELAKLRENVDVLALCGKRQISMVDHPFWLLG